MFKKKKLSYVDAHNNAVSAYKRSTTAIIFIGIFNVVGAIFYLVQINGVSNNLMGQFLCLGLDMFIFSIPPVASFLINNLPWTVVIYLLLFFGTSAIYCWLGAVALRGKKNYLFAGSILYLIDWVFLLCCYFFRNDLISDESLFLMIGVHVIVTVFIFMAIYQYHKVISIEIQHAKAIQIQQKQKQLNQKIEAEQEKEDEKNGNKK